MVESLDEGLLATIGISNRFFIINFFLRLFWFQEVLLQLPFERLKQNWHFFMFAVALYCSQESIDLDSEHVDGGASVLDEVLDPAEDVSESPLVYQIVKAFIFIPGDLIDCPEDSFNNFEIIGFGVILQVLIQFFFLVSEEFDFTQGYFM